MDKVRNTIVVRMNKPLEVKIDIDENGDITTDPTTNTIYQTLHDAMKMTLIYLTHLDPVKTQADGAERRKTGWQDLADEGVRTKLL